jgi:hypothetical protein
MLCVIVCDLENLVNGQRWAAAPNNKKLPQEIREINSRLPIQRDSLTAGILYTELRVLLYKCSAHRVIAARSYIALCHSNIRKRHAIYHQPYQSYRLMNDFGYNRNVTFPFSAL